MIHGLQSTLAEVEASAGVSADDPALLALKSIILRRIAELGLVRPEQEPEDSPHSEIEVPI